MVHFWHHSAANTKRECCIIFEKWELIICEPKCLSAKLNLSIEEAEIDTKELEIIGRTTCSIECEAKQVLGLGIL